MSEIKSLLFSHSHHLLTVRGCSALLDVLSFEGEEALSEPFRYVIEFTSADKTITPQQMLMQDATFTLQAPADQGFGINIQQPVRTIQGVVTAFERLSASRDETHYSLTLQPRLALLSRSHQNRIYQICRCRISWSISCVPATPCAGRTLFSPRHRRIRVASR